MIIARFEKAYGYKGVGRSGQGGQAALSLAGKQAGVLRSIVKQSVGPCKTEASQKPVHLDPRLVRTLRAWRRAARFRQPTDWVFAGPVLGSSSALIHVEHESPLLQVRGLSVELSQAFIPPSTVRFAPVT